MPKTFAPKKARAEDYLPDDFHRARNVGKPLRPVTAADLGNPTISIGGRTLPVPGGNIQTDPSAKFRIGHTAEELAGIQPGTGPSKFGAPDDIPTPAAYLDGIMEEEMQAIDEKYRTKWNMIQEHVKYLGPDKAQQMLTDLLMQGKNEVAGVQAKFKQRAGTLGRVEKLHGQGAIDDAKYRNLSWTIAGGKALADSMYSEEEEEVDTLAAMSKINTAETQAQAYMDKYEVTPATPGGFWSGPKPRSIKRRRGTDREDIADQSEALKAYDRNAQDLHLVRNVDEAVRNGVPYSKAVAAAKRTLDYDGSSTLGDRVRAEALVKKSPPGQEELYALQVKVQQLMQTDPAAARRMYDENIGRFQ